LYRHGLYDIIVDIEFNYEGITEQRKYEKDGGIRQVRNDYYKYIKKNIRIQDGHL